MSTTHTLKTHDGLDLFVQDWLVDNPRAEIVLTHGIGEHSDNYEHLIKALNDAGYSVFAHDLRGHGRSGGVRVFTPSIGHIMQDVDLVVKRAQTFAPGKKLFVYGHSMGGNITLNFALRHPQGLSGVIATGPWLKLPQEPPAPLVLAGRVLNKLSPTYRFVRPGDDNLLSRDAEMVARRGKDPMRSEGITARQFVELSGSAKWALEHASELQMPILLAHGAADQITSPEGTKQFFADVKAADKTLKLYPNCRHELHNEILPDRDIFLQDVVAWLNART